MEFVARGQRQVRPADVGPHRRGDDARCQLHPGRRQGADLHRRKRWRAPACNFHTGTRWGETCKALGFPGLHFHALRQTGNTLAAQTGDNLLDLMTRMGHDSPRAALIYQHASSGADRAIADALDLLIAATEELADKPSAEHDQDDDGTGQSTDPAG